MRQRVQSSPFVSVKINATWAARSHARLLVEQYGRAALFVSVFTFNEGSPTMADECQL